MTVKPYKFRFKKVSSREQRLLNALYEYLPATGVREAVESSIEEAISRHVGQQAKFHLEAVHQEIFSDYVAKIPTPTTLAVFGMAPLNKKAICEIDPVLAVVFVERLLGGNPSLNLNIRELSDTEQGVLQYLILQVLANIYRECGQNPRLHFRFDRFLQNEVGLKEMVGQSEGMAVLVFRVKVGRHSGFIRLAFPDPFIEENFLNVESVTEVRSEEREYNRMLLSRFNYIRVPVWAECGRATIMPIDLAGIEAGDIVLLDESDVSIADGHIAGKAIIRIGDGKRGGLDSELSVHKKSVSCKVTGFHK